jgi:hypothetical protein
MIEICPATTFDDKSSKASNKNAVEKKVYHFNDIVYQWYSNLFRLYLEW